MRKQTKIAALVSAAALLTIGASMTSFAKWDVEDGQWVYLDGDGEKVEYEWKKSGADWYYLGEGGYMATDQLIDDDEYVYYVGTDGRRVTNDWRSVPNDEGEEINGTVVDTLWYYFGSSGKAYQAKDGKDLVKKTVPWSGGSNVFFFDAEGHMLNGWVTDYLEADGTTDDNIYYLGDESEGWARAKGTAGSNGWYYLEVPEVLKARVVSTDEYDDEEWFYFQSSGKAYRADEGKGTTSKYIDNVYYTFDEQGVLQDDWFTVASDGQPASSPRAFSGVDGNKTGWVYTHRDGDEDTNKWFYLVNLTNGKMVAYGSGNGEKDLFVKNIAGKTYAFDGRGEMLSGLVEVKTGDTKKYQPHDTWNGQSSIKLTDGYYLFSKAAASQGDDGRMLTGKQSYTSDDVTDYYYFRKAADTSSGYSKGSAITQEIKSNCLYGVDGKRVSAQDGNSYDVVKLTYNIVKIDDLSGSIKAGKSVVVSSSGKIRKTGNVTIDGTVYEVSNYVVVGSYEKGAKETTYNDKW